VGLDLRLPRHRPPPINDTEAQSSRRLPQHLIGGSIGSTGNMVSNLFGAGPLRWLCGLLLSWTFPNISGGRARVAQAEASTRAALATYDGTVPKALQETRPRSTLMPHALNQRQAQQEWNAQARVAANISRAQFREVRVDFLLYWILNVHWRKN